MKKLMIATFAMAMAVVASAGTTKWGTSTGQYIYLPDGGAKAGALSAYLFDALSYDQDALIADFAAAKTTAGVKVANALDTKELSSAKVSGSTTGLTADQSYSLYMVVIDSDNNNVFITDAKPLTGPGEGKTATATWSTTNPSKGEVSTSSTFGSMGWYTVSSADTPEPTSGLLLLLGVAGLALRRRRA